MEEGKTKICRYCMYALETVNEEVVYCVEIDNHIRAASKPCGIWRLRE